MEKSLSSEEQSKLLKISRDSITETVTGRTDGSKFSANGNLLLKRGCFVTLHLHGRLRGCIGTFSAEKPLHAAVREMAAAAATQDPRFYPVRADEIEQIKLEISVLSPLKKIASIEEIQVGVHGLYIEKNLFHGVLLPQVAVEQGWDRTTFLNQTCLKAGLDKDAWQSEADIYIFSAQVFREH
ncbi:MAG: AmmeMemoRadiSam system protein A [Geobacteraceae bacterium]|nr:AmmeMemoRadiSam system protein A [Geobacteraceae bacterium]